MGSSRMLPLLFAALFGVLAGSHGLPANLRVYQGEPVNITDYPYQVSLQIDGAHQCGASIISKQWALTAAHCLYFLDDSNVVTVRSGSSFREEGGTVYEVSQNIICKNFSMSGSDCDIAAVKVASPFKLGDTAKIIPLATVSPAAGSVATLTGWGMTTATSTLAHQLQMVHIPVVGSDQCNEMYGGGVTKNMMCAGVVGTPIGPCIADSGSPLVVDGIQVGIVSHGRSNGCGGSSLPAVYSDIANLRDWIKENTGV